MMESNRVRRISIHVTQGARDLNIQASDFCLNASTPRIGSIVQRPDWGHFYSIGCVVTPYRNKWTTVLHATYLRVSVGRKLNVAFQMVTCLPSYAVIFFFLMGWDWVHLVLRPLLGLLYQPQIIDNNDCGAISGMRIFRGNRSTLRKPAPVPLCPLHMQ
jgi:hypothetical protein